VNGQQIDFFETTIEPFQKQIYPDLGPANLVGYNGVAPGPTYYVKKGTQTVIRYHNNHTDDSVVHLHGSSTHTPWDGWPSDSISFGQYKDYYYPNEYVYHLQTRKLSEANTQPELMLTFGLLAVKTLALSGTTTMQTVSLQ
jgi:hypothetical protein